jgi:hypothetical protein
LKPGKGAQCRHDREPNGRRADEPPREGTRGGFPAAIARAQIERDQRGVERAFGQQSARQIEHLKGDKEGVRPYAGAEQRRDQHVAHEA